jgi:hypothetical protein
MFNITQILKKDEANMNKSKTQHLHGKLDSFIIFNDDTLMIKIE